MWTISGMITGKGRLMCLEEEKKKPAQVPFFPSRIPVSGLNFVLMIDKSHLTIAVYCKYKNLPSYYCAVNKDWQW
jgi:hypothetical protein